VTTIGAPAKLTLSLRVTGVRDDGYHLIDAEMITLDLADRLDIIESSAAGATSITVSGPFAAGVPTDGSNLVAKALDRIGRPATVHIDKQIPSQGGLGGGSADAAAILRWAGIDDVDLAVRLGADVPFCLRGGRARVRGIGEVLDPLPIVPCPVTLCVPPFGISTVRCYRAWDELGGPTADGPNDLEPAAVSVEPRLREWLDTFGEVTGSAAVLAGSGSTMFVHGHHREAIDVIGRSLPGTVVLLADARG